MEKTLENQIEKSVKDIFNSSMVGRQVFSIEITINPGEANIEIGEFLTDEDGLLFIDEEHGGISRIYKEFDINLDK